MARKARKRASWTPNYTEALRPFLDRQPIKRPGRPKKLVEQELGRLLKAIAVISSNNRKCNSANHIAQVLKRGQVLTQGYDDYPHLSVTQLRRNVTEAMAWEVRMLKSIPLARWEELLGIEPPASLSPKLLRAKALEHLRHELRRHQLMDKNS
jgi:hypothetical protein